MKKIYIAIAVLGTLLLSSCVQEKSFNDISVGENEVAFVLQNTATRSAEEGSPLVKKGISIPIETTESEETLFLEETIEELNPAPATKGAPVYTSNLGQVYKTMGVYADNDSFGKTTRAFVVIDEYENPNGGDGWRYNYDFDQSPWPDKTTPVDFYLHMPSSLSGVTFDANAPYKDKKTKFELTSPLEGKTQQDILFAQTTISKEQHDGYLPKGAPVMMYHALTGIKFRNGHMNDNQTKTIITRVELIGLKGYGKCTFDGTTNTFDWPKTDLGSPSTEENPFYLAFDNPTYDEEKGASNPDGTVGTTGNKTWDEGLSGTSWTSAAADHNLNNTNGELTFWFIPQEVTDDVILKVYFTVKTPDSVEGFLSDACHTIRLGEKLNNKYHEAGKTGNLKWEAGQLRTYTLEPYDVDVAIKDNITATVKSNLHVANLGNVDEYVRMLVIGNWYGWKPGADDETDAQVMAKGDPSILVGYKYKGDESGLTDAQKKEMVLPWYREGYPYYNGVYYASKDVAPAGYIMKDPYGEFDESFPLANLGKDDSIELGENGNRDGARNDWADASGGFYYTMPIGPGDGVNTAVSATKDLFESYTVTDVPTIWIPVGNTRKPAVGVHLVLEIAIQAIAVPKDESGNDVWWLQAWYDATGIPKLNPTYSKNSRYVGFYNDGVYTPDSETTSGD